jgi:hypothetical protein
MCGKLINQEVGKHENMMSMKSQQIPKEFPKQMTLRIEVDARAHGS